MSIKPEAAPKPRILRVCWTGPHEPEPGDFLRSKGGKVLYSIQAVEVIHHAYASRKPRLRLTIEAMPPDQPEYPLSGILLWSYTTPPGPGVAKHPASIANAAAFRAAAAKADRKAVARVERIKQQHLDPLAPEASRLTAPDRSADDTTPRSAGELDSAQWRNPSDINNPMLKSPRSVQGFRTACGLTRMQRKAGSRIKAQHITAANKVRAAYEIARLGFGGESYAPMTSKVAPRPKADHGAAAQRQLGYSKEFARIWRIIGPSRQRMFLQVVIRHRSITAWCAAEKLRGSEDHDPGVEMGKLLGILDRLVDEYRGQIRTDEMMGNVA